jgi:hypothetical protein
MRYLLPAVRLPDDFDAAGSRIVDEVLPLASPADDAGRDALVSALSGRLTSTSDVQSLLSALDRLPAGERHRACEIEEALRTALFAEGIGQVDKSDHINIVAQLVPRGTGNDALEPIQSIVRTMERYPYNLQAKSLVQEGVDEDGLKILIERIEGAIETGIDKDPRALILLPISMRSSPLLQRLDGRIRVQFVTQETDPDTVMQFGLGFLMLEYDRSEDKSPEKHRGLLNMIAAMTGEANPEDILRKLFDSDFTLKIRRIDWGSIDDQRRSWHAVARSL